MAVPTSRLTVQPLLIAAYTLFAVTSAPGATKKKAEQARPSEIAVTSRASLIHIGSLDSFDVTRGGKDAAQRILDFLEKGDRTGAEDAIGIYRRIIPDENFGGEYTALQWLMECELATETERQEKFLADPLVESFHRLLSKDEWAPLRSFLRDKYHLGGEPEENTDRVKLAETRRRNRFLEDFILFANPRREAWEKSSQMIAALKLKPGDKVADVGSGPGFFSFAFAKIVGNEGKVFAIDNNPEHLAYLHETIDRLGYENVEAVMPSQGGIGVSEPVDVVYMCSLYHNLYAISTDKERNLLLGSIRDSLKPEGKLVLVDNTPVLGTLPYHGPYIARELIVQQLARFGFKLLETHQFIPQRYVLVFGVADTEPTPAEPADPLPPPVIPEGGIIAHSLKELPPTFGVAELADASPARIRVLSERSLVATQGPGTGPIYSNAGRKAADLFWNALNTMNTDKLRETSETYGSLIPRERTGDEYSALQWFADYLLTPEAERPALLSDPQVADYFNFFGGEEFKRLKSYLKNKYLLGELAEKFKELQATNTQREATATSDDDAEAEPDQAPPYYDLPLDVDVKTLIAWWEYMAFSNPRRELWEKSHRIFDFLKIKPGDKVADVGSGSGFYTFKFAEKVGDKGKVFALDLADDQLENLRRGAEKLGLSNIETIVSREDDATLPANSIDVAYLCSLYHATYVHSMEYVKDRFMASLRKALKPNGRLVIVDNEPIPSEEGGYYGPRIAKELLISQLTQYGFRFSAYAQFIPQRYVLVFDVNKSAAPAKRK